MHVAVVVIARISWDEVFCAVDFSGIHHFNPDVRVTLDFIDEDLQISPWEVCDCTSRNLLDWFLTMRQGSILNKP